MTVKGIEEKVKIVDLFTTDKNLVEHLRNNCAQFRIKGTEMGVQEANGECTIYSIGPVKYNEKFRVEVVGMTNWDTEYEVRDINDGGNIIALRQLHNRYHEINYFGDEMWFAA